MASRNGRPREKNNQREVDALQRRAEEMATCWRRCPSDYAYASAFKSAPFNTSSYNAAPDNTSPDNTSPFYAASYNAQHHTRTTGSKLGHPFIRGHV